MTVVNLWVGLSVLMVITLALATWRMASLFRVVEPDEEDLREEAWSRLRPVGAVLLQAILTGLAAGVVQYLPPSWHARMLTVPLLFAGQLVLFAYALRLWWELEEIFDGRIYRAANRLWSRITKGANR